MKYIKQRRAKQSLGSATFFVMVGQPRNMLAGKYLARPTSAKGVKRYGFTKKWREAWPFKTRQAAEAKARIVEHHMEWGAGVAIILPLPNAQADS
jgi:hypothetical protein